MPKKRQPRAASLETPSKSVEDFLKAVYSLQQDAERVSTNALADHLSVKAPSVTDMARRMEGAGLIYYKKYHGMRLTEQGERLALTVIRRHRLIELYLMQELGYELREVHAEAERLEHAVSDRFIEALDRKLGKPDIDPHGDPIPSPEGYVAPSVAIPLTELPVNTDARIARLLTSSPDLLQHVVDREFRLGDAIRVTARDPFHGPLTVSVNGRREILGYTVAASIYVDAVPD
jgi:DtxR family Mn-dependent transcriptional regulator